MDLNALHSLMSAKGYHYFEGDTNSIDDELCIYFSTIHGGRGDSLDLTIRSDSTDVIGWTHTGTETRLENLTDADLFKLIETL